MSTKLTYPAKYGVSTIFSVADLNPYYEDWRKRRTSKFEVKRRSSRGRCGDHPIKSSEGHSNKPESSTRFKETREVRSWLERSLTNRTVSCQLYPKIGLFCLCFRAEFRWDNFLHASPQSSLCLNFQIRQVVRHLEVGVFMVRVSEPKEISVRIPEISGR